MIDKTMLAVNDLGEEIERLVGNVLRKLIQSLLFVMY
jgi:hypothetical protein